MKTTYPAGVACKLASLLLVLGLLGAGSLEAEESPATGPGGNLPPEWSAREDHQHMLGLLGIQSLRRGADGMNPAAPNYQNTDESKANPWPTLPDPLVLKNGAPVTSPETWWKQRRPEIQEDFDREIYGRVPAQLPAVRWEVLSSEDATDGAFAVRRRNVVGRVDNSAFPAITVAIELSVTLPARTQGPVPVMLELGFNFPGRRGGGAAPQRTDWRQLVLERGWGHATLVPTSIQADSGAGLRKGIIGLANQGKPRKPEDWGALRAWAWGASRALDYLATDPAIDAKHVGVEGLSRYGKAALVAMAYDERFAVGFIGSSGAGGAKLFRRNWGELVENLAGSGEYHWMAGNFLKYAGPLNAGDLPVDAHELLALCAPRPVFISYGASKGPGAEGNWVDQRGSFLAAVAASPVYTLLGKKGLGTREMPPVETGLVEGDLAFRQHAGGHTTGPNWPTFLEFAGRYFPRSSRPEESSAPGAGPSGPR